MLVYYGKYPRQHKGKFNRRMTGNSMFQREQQYHSHIGVLKDACS